MQTSSYRNWMRRPLSIAVCPTPDIWPDALYEPAPVRARRPQRVAGKIRTPRRERRRERRNPVVTHITAGATTVLTDVAHQPVASKEEFMNKEKLRILKMLEEGKVSADEAARLMEALDKSEARPKASDLKRKWLHIRVQEHGRDTVNMRVPLALLKFGFKLAPEAARHHAARGRRRAERGRERAQRAREKAIREREKAMRQAERTAERMRRKLEGTLGEHPGLNIDDVVNQAVRESMEEVNKAIEESLEEAEEALGEHGRNGFGMFAGKDFDLDLDQILEMAQSEGFDGKILDVHDEEDDEHVTITLE